MHEKQISEGNGKASECRPSRPTFNATGEESAGALRADLHVGARGRGDGRRGAAGASITPAPLPSTVAPVSGASGMHARVRVSTYRAVLGCVWSAGGVIARWHVEQG